MKWTRPLIDLLRADFGGFPTFCCDPDNILDIPAAREAVRAAALNLDEWDGSESGLARWQRVPADQKPVIVAPDAASRLIIEAHVPDYRWQAVSVSDIFPAFAPEIVRELPVDLWEKVFELGAGLFHRLSSDETLDRLGRGLYGLDPQYLRFGRGWWWAWLEVAGHEQGWPPVIAQWAAQAAPSPFVGTERLIQTLTVPDAARAHLMALHRERPDVVEELSPALRAGIERFAPLQLAPPTPTGIVGKNALLSNSRQSSIEAFNVSQELSFRRSAEDVLAFARRFAARLPLGAEDERCLEADKHFAAWLQRNYSLAMTASGSEALSLPRLVAQLDSETGDTPLLLAVVDSLSLRAWQVVKRVWIADGIMGSCRERSAFAVVPTITSLSRRAIFEGRLPARFGPERHTQSLERKLWKNRFGTRGDYFAPVEHLGISDAFATRRERVAVVDVQWDSKGHAIDPRFETIEEEAEKWAARTDMRKVIQQGLAQGYRVVLASDHGNVACRGIGRPNVGETVSDRSKRCLVFKSAELREQHAAPDAISWTPNGLEAAMHPLFAPGFDSFDYTGSRGVSHGGLSLEEAIVPVVDLDK